MIESNENQVDINTVSKEGEKGASLVEYALLVALIAIVAIAAVQFVGTRVSTRFSTIGSAL